ncbi:MAG: MogA/MoaB family molybdenum cofactor biosynthesis protein [Chloroflexi bacterium]|nr:MogA/MoaB family molybdenum cofactor biosynthesis protein [Chloroflexota bacterium]MDA1282131.1 MogA/MoaB family molybdenum cofactor biosynthesis protein [Chloroflexota bacterium]
MVIEKDVRRDGETEIVTYAVLTSSDTGSAGKRVDTSGDAIVEIMGGAGHKVVNRVMLPDDIDQLSTQIKAWCDSGKVDVILTTGGTGLSSRDVMPEVTRGLIDLEIPGMAEAMRAESLKVTKMAMISRAVTGARGSTLIINLPGSTCGVRDNLSVVLPVIEHGVEVLQDRQAGDHPI